MTFSSALCGLFGSFCKPAARATLTNSDVKRVYAKALTALHNIESEDTLVATIEFANGAIGTLEAATSVFPGYDIAELRSQDPKEQSFSNMIEFVSAGLKTPSVLELETQPQDTNRSSKFTHRQRCNRHKRILEDFINVIKTGGQPRCDGYQGRRSVNLVQAVYQSARTGQPVDVQES